MYKDSKLLTNFKYLKLICVKVEKKRAWFVSGLVLLSSALESIGIATLFPLFSMLVNPDFQEESSGIARVLSPIIELEALGVDGALWPVTILACSIFIISALVRIICIRKINIFIEQVRVAISTGALEYILAETQKNIEMLSESEITGLVISEVDQLINTLIKPIMNFFVGFCYFIFLFVVLFLINPVATAIICLLLSLIYLSIYYLSRTTLGALGRSKLINNQRRFNILQTTLGGRKEILVRSVESLFISEFESKAYRFGKALADFRTLNQGTAVCVELVAFCAILFGFTWFVGSDERAINPEQLIPTLAVFGAALARMKPSVQLMYQGFSSLRYTSAVVEKLQFFFDKNRDSGCKACIPQRKVVHSRFDLAAVGLEYSLVAEEKVLWSDVNIFIPAGSKFIITGNSGSGKSTFLDVLAGFKKASNGQVMLNNQILTMGLREFWGTDLVGIVPQTVFIADTSLRKNVALGVAEDEINDDKVRTCLEMACFPMDFGTEFLENDVPAMRLSGGQKQRLALARCLYSEAKILLLDEVGSGLDAHVHKKLLGNLVRLLPYTTILLVTHHPELAKGFEHALVFGTGGAR